MVNTVGTRVRELTLYTKKRRRRRRRENDIHYYDDITYYYKTYVYIIVKTNAFSGPHNRVVAFLILYYVRAQCLL